MEELSEEEKRALRGSKFAPLPPPRSQPRLAHPGGPLKTNKAAALAKFLERKVQNDPDGLSSINPDLLELAVRNAKAAIVSGGSSSSGTIIRHVDSFDDHEVSLDEREAKNLEPKKQKQKQNKKRQKQKQKKKKQQQKIMVDSEGDVGKKPKKKLKL